MAAIFANPLTLKDPENQEAAKDLEDTITEAGAFMRRQPGFRRFRLVRSVKNPECYLIYAEWDDLHVLETAIARPDVRSRAAHVRELTQGAPKIYEVVTEAELPA
ncbi:antibiotic biosynthesis monooxygenase [Streptomyces sp. NA02950]|uniref:antibiotic biosynthesis monooxygenase family protein n=1 Tax=Streptomyces sp. NA02950 TaxID=2742137 RepID=UPI0015902095|nr:antibiotic biosynthesis monooxygenase family protein [Streptomyces sp. NA02950]QKV93067.1 antibiotic biosynthesis monooxygenase [Streptomyces sp. NA02950]